MRAALLRAGQVCPKDVGPEKDLLDSDPFNDGKVYRAGSASKNLNKGGENKVGARNCRVGCV